MKKTKQTSTTANRTFNTPIFGVLMSIIIIATLLFSVAHLSNEISMLKKEVVFLNKQSLQFNGRTNNLEGCWKNQDFECPENKYFDASQFMRDSNTDN